MYLKLNHKRILAIPRQPMPDESEKIIYTAFADVLNFGTPCICMKIQEMKSGSLYLNKRMEEKRQDNFFTARPAGEAPTGEVRPRVEAISDLDRPMWSVVSFDRCEAYGLPYRQAVDLMSQFDARGVTGLCIVTDEAAKRIRR